MHFWRLVRKLHGYRVNSERSIVRFGIWTLLTLVAAGICGLYVYSLRPRGTPPLPIFGAIPDFKLTNQLGKVVSLGDLRGHIWVGDIIFTSCPGPCLQMTKRMQAIAAALPPQSSVKLVSLTADPAYDTPPVLNKYATRFKADPNQWNFLTGPKQEVYDLAMNGLKLAVQENPAGTPSEDQFIHSTRLVLIDRQGRLRSVSSDGTETNAVGEVLHAIETLQQER